MYLMDFWQSFEIDEKDDWKMLETIQKIYIKK
jgi:CMP-N-acetylneuraminic acid synthetase